MLRKVVAVCAPREPIPGRPPALSVLNAHAEANVLAGCTPAIEGCTDPTALNYDALANVNSHTWCVPRRGGCMLPADGAAGAAYENPSPHGREGHGALSHQT